jgi:N4-gp56 family major capsid protein
MAQQVWYRDIDGGYWGSPKLSADLRHQAQPQMRFLQKGLVRTVTDFSKHDSDQILFDKISNLISAGRVISETETVPITKTKTYRSSLTVYERGLAVSWTGKLDLLSQFSPNEIATIALKNDMAKCRDKAAGAAFQTTDMIYVPTGTVGAPTFDFATTGTPGASATRSITAYDVKVISRLMQTYNIPLWDSANYICISSINGLQDLADDDSWVEAAQFGDPARLFSGEIGRYWGVRFLTENNVLNGAIGTGGACGEMIFIGADAVIQAVAEPPHLRLDIPSDFGRENKMAWLSTEGFCSTWDYSTEGETHILRVFSL